MLGMGPRSQGGGPGGWGFATICRATEGRAHDRSVICAVRWTLDGLAERVKGKGHSSIISDISIMTVCAGGMGMRGSACKCVTVESLLLSTPSCRRRVAGLKLWFKLGGGGAGAIRPNGAIMAVGWSGGRNRF